MASPFTLSIPLDSRQRLVALLSPEQLKKAEFRIVDRATRTVKTNVNRIIRQEIALKQKTVDEAMTMSVKGDPPEGRITIKGTGIPYVEFPHTASKTDGVKVTIYRNKPPFILRHAFEAVMPTGHEGIFLRGDHLPTSGENAGRGYYIDKRTGRKMPLWIVKSHGFASRLVINEEKSRSLASLVSLPDIWSKIEVDAQKVLRDRAEAQLKLFLKGDYTAPSN